MKDLTVLQAVKQLRRLFPQNTCKVEASSFSYGYNQSGLERLRKSLYVAGIPELVAVEAPTFRKALEIAKNYKEGMKP